MTAILDILAVSVHPVEHMRDMHLAEVRIAFVHQRIGAIIGYEPGQTLHIPSHIFLAREVEVRSGTRLTIVILGQIDDMVVLAKLRIDISILLRREGIESQYGVHRGAEIHQVTIGSGTVRRIDRQPERGVILLEYIVFRRTRHAVVLIGLEGERRTAKG